MVQYISLNYTYARLLHILWHCSSTYLPPVFLSLSLSPLSSLGNSCIVRIINALSHCTQIKRLSPGEKRRQLYRLCPDVLSMDPPGRQIPF